MAVQSDVARSAASAGIYFPLGMRAIRSGPLRRRRAVCQLPRPPLESLLDTVAGERE